MVQMGVDGELTRVIGTLDRHSPSKSLLRNGVVLEKCADRSIFARDLMSEKQAFLNDELVAG
jgi:hypothetical protein